METHVTKPPIDFTTRTANPDLPSVSDVLCEEVARKTDAVHLIDVRLPDEYTGDLGHIPGAKLITLNMIPDRLGELPKDEPILFICRSGARSARAAAFAIGNGFTHVYNLKGGMIRWNELGLAVEHDNQGI